MLLFIANERLHSAKSCGAFKSAPIRRERGRLGQQDYRQVLLFISIEYRSFI